MIGTSHTLDLCFGGECVLALWALIENTSWPVVCLKGVSAVLSVALVVPKETQVNRGEAENSGRVQTYFSPAFVARCSAQWPMEEVVYCEFLFKAHVLGSLKSVL